MYSGVTAGPTFSSKSRVIVYRSDDGAAVPVYRYELPIIVNTHIMDRPDLRQFYTHEELHGRPIPSAQTDVSGGSGENVRTHRTWKDLSTAATEGVLKPHEALERIALFKEGKIPMMQPQSQRPQVSTSTNGYHAPETQAEAQPVPQRDPELLSALQSMTQVMTNMQTQLNDLERRQQTTMQYIAETMMQPETETDTDTDTYEDAQSDTAADHTGADGTDREGTNDGR